MAAAEFIAGREISLSPETVEAFGALAVSEGQEAELRAASQEASSARWATAEIEGGGCFGDGTVVSESRELKAAYADAFRAWHQQYDQVVWPAQLAIWQALSQEPNLHPFERTGLTQSLFREGSDRPIYAARFTTALEQLDDRLKPGTPIFVHDRETNRDGFFRTTEAGIRVKDTIDDAHVSPPKIVVSTGSLRGTALDRYAGIVDKHSPGSRELPDGVALYDPARYYESLKELEDLVTYGANHGLSLIREGVSLRLTNREDRAWDVAALVAARREGMAVELADPLDDDERSQLIDAAIKAVFARLTGQVLDIPREDLAVFTGGCYRGFEVHIAEASYLTLGHIAALGGLEERPAVEEILSEKLSELEAGIFEGHELAQRLPEVTVGRHRLNSVLNQLFPRQTRHQTD